MKTLKIEVPHKFKFQGQDAIIYQRIFFKIDNSKLKISTKLIKNKWNGDLEPDFKKVGTKRTIKWINKILERNQKIETDFFKQLPEYENFYLKSISKTEKRSTIKTL